MQKCDREAFLNRLGPMYGNDGEGKSDAVYHSLLFAIQNGRLTQKEKLPSNDALCEIFGVSRSSVRSALERLKGLGLLESSRGAGTYVACVKDTGANLPILPAFMLNRADRLSIFEFRRIMETEMAALAASRATTEQVDLMRESIARMKNASNKTELITNDVGFHYLIAQATQNPIIIQIFDVMRPTYEYLIEGNVEIVGNSGAIYHHKIVTAIEMRDSNLARQLMTEHLLTTIQRTSEIN